jgi:hypothetical protein
MCSDLTALGKERAAKKLDDVICANGLTRSDARRRQPWLFSGEQSVRQEVSRSFEKSGATRETTLSHCVQIAVAFG